METLAYFLWLGVVLAAPFIAFFGAFAGWGWANDKGRYTYPGAAAIGMGVFLAPTGVYMLAVPFGLDMAGALDLGPGAGPWLMAAPLLASAAVLLAVLAVRASIMRRALYVAALPGALLALAHGGTMIWSHGSPFGVLVALPAGVALALFAFMAIANPPLRPAEAMPVSSEQ